MPGKSKRKKSKRYQPLSKKGKSRRHLEAPVAQQAAVTESEPVSQPGKSTPPVSVPSPLAGPTAVRYPFIATELRAIGILAGIIMIVLIILFFVLR
jgi:hypothetical protein